MFNRANKATALLVAAAAVVSLVPATGVNAADYKRIESKDGKIYNAVAYKGGSVLVDGNIKDGDTDAVYFLNEGKYTELEDIDTGADFDGAFADKYVSIDNGDYFVDLTNGKVTDEDLKEDSVDDAAVALRKAIRNNADERYSNHADLKTSLEKIAGNVFGETWYKTTYKSENETNGGAAGTTDLTVYTDAKGNYIDADYNLGKFKVKVSKHDTTTNTTTTSSAVTIENTDKKYDSLKDEDLSAKVTDAKVIGQDSKNIYRTATITVNAGENTVVEINGKAVSTATTEFKSNDGYKTVSFEVIQKISKEQASDDIDGAKYAKTVTNYVMADEDVKKVDDLLTNATYSIADGKVVAHTFTSGKVKAQTIEFKTSRGFNYIDTKEADEKDATVVDVDANGNLWMLDGGYVFQYDNDEDWNKVYKVDGSMEKMSVYDKDNMVVWNESDEVYSIIGAKEETEETKPEVTTGWNKNTDGTWTFVKADGTKATGWLQDGANWYFLNAAGIMQTGWINDNGTWYFTNASGAMATGWQNVNGTWYFLAGNGAMQTGWINDNGTWYFTDASGKMLANTTVNGYVLGANGAWVK